MTTKIRVMKEEDIDSIMDIWIQENISAHNFIDEKYWKTNKDKVQNQILKSKTFVYEDENEIKGFIGLSGNYIEGLFVKSQYQRRGIGKELLKHCKGIFWSLILKVYSENEAAYNAPINGNCVFLFLTLPFYLLAYQSVGITYVAVTNNLRLSLSAGSFYTAIGFTFAGVTYPVFAMPTLGCIFANLLPIHHWLKIGLGQTLLGIPVKYQLHVCLVLLLFCLLPLPFLPKLKRNAADEKCWGKY